MHTELTTVERILTRTSGYLAEVCSHSLQPYRGCPFGQSLCGVGCYVQHARHLTRGRSWGSFLEVRQNASESYRRHYSRERSWARTNRGGFSIFMSSATEPFPPQESRYQITSSLLDVMRELPPDVLIVQTHSHHVAREVDRLSRLAERCAVRVQMSIESDRDRLPGLPRSASTVDDRFGALSRLKEAGLKVVVTVSPLLPIENPAAFFERIASVADGVVLDHFIGGDGSKFGSRTLRTALPDAMEAVHPGASSIAYREEMFRLASAYMPGRVGVGADGFAGRWRTEVEI